jgi:cytochrome c-type biogenesis protein
MDGVPIGLALAAGTMAVVNPCGFALLPAYAGLLVLGDEPPRRGVAVGRALGFAAAMTIGFVAVFGVFGLVLAPVAGAIQERLPWFTVVFGLVLAALGGWLVAGRSLPAPRIATRSGSLTRSFGSMTLFGVAYALASLGCTIGPFLVTVVATFRSGSTSGGVAVFAAYALGMGLVVAAVSLSVAVARGSVVSALRRAGRLVSRLGGLLLLLAGGYVAYYGWYEIRVLRGASVDDPVIAAGATIQRWLASGLDWIGVVGAAIGVAALLGIAIAVRSSRRTGPGT